MTALTLRLARLDEAAALSDLIAASVNGLQTGDYSSAQRAAALGSVFGVDRRLIEDETYFVAEAGEAMAGCGGWSRRRTLFGADALHGRDDGLLDPATEAARIRAFFVHPDFARQGVGGAILAACEAAAGEAGFTRLELGATLTGVVFYRRHGFVEIDRVEANLPGGLGLPIVRMRKQLGSG